MRRRMFWQQDFIRYLKSIGCKLYFPFDNKYNLDAAIGDTSVTVVNTGFFHVISEVEMAQVITRTLNAVVAYINTNFTEDDFPTNEWTLFSQVMRNNTSGATSGSSRVFQAANNGLNSCVQACINDEGDFYTGNWKTDTKYSTFTIIDKDNDTADFYSYAPDKMITQYQMQVTLFAKPTTQQRYNAFAANSTQINRRVYLGQMMIFNRKLTDKEMKKIIDYLL